MTGFGVGDAMLAGTDDAPPRGDKLTVEIRAVNHRFLDVRVRVPSQRHLPGGSGTSRTGGCSLFTSSVLVTGTIGCVNVIVR